MGRLDDDEWPDLVLTSLKLYYPTDKLPEPLPATLAVLWGSSDGVDAAHPSTLAVPNAISAAVGDLNGDGRGDLAVAVHQGRVTTEALSRIFLGDGSRELSSIAGTPVPTTGAQGVTFAQLLDEVRADLARMYLGDSQLAVFEVAFLLGYSEPSAFNRAFRRWTGQTPSEYRKAP